MTVNHTDPHSGAFENSASMQDVDAQSGAVSRDAWVLFTIGVILMTGTFFASRGIIVIDEIIYLVSAGALQSTGSQLFDNGYDRFPSLDLTMGPFFSARDDGLLGSQYPIGQQLAGAILHPILGPRGLYFLNAVAALVTLFATYALAMRLFRDRQIALWSCLLLTIGSYWAEYNYGYWPHMISIAAVVVSLNLSLMALTEERAGPVLKASALAGLILGAGMVFRVDSILLLPVLAVLAITIGRRPVHVFVGGALGLIPGIAVLAWSNYVKFDTFNPLSYGPARASSGLEKYYLMIGVGLAGLCFLIAWRCLAPRFRRHLVLTGIALVGLAVIIVPQARGLVMAFVNGIENLIVDSRATPDDRPSIDFRPDGTVLFWGLAKKALGQSMPWIGMLPLLALPALAGRRTAIAILGLLCLIWVTPFVLQSWHGGLGSNMRYFLPILPAICILGVAVLQAQVKAAALGPRAIIYSVLVGCLLGAVWISLHPTGLAGAAQILSLYVLLGCLVVAVVALVVRTPRSASASVIAFGVGIGVAVSNLLTDISHAQQRREHNALTPDFETVLAGEIVVFDRIVMSAAGNPDQLLALSVLVDGPDPELISGAFDAGMAVAMHADQAMASFPNFDGLEVTETGHGLGPDFVVLRRAAERSR